MFNQHFTFRSILYIFLQFHFPVEMLLIYFLLYICVINYISVYKYFISLWRIIEVGLCSVKVLLALAQTSFSISITQSFLRSPSF